MFNVLIAALATIIGILATEIFSALLKDTRKRVVELVKNADEVDLIDSDIDDDLQTESTCLNCKTAIPINETDCPDCGWTYDIAYENGPNVFTSRTKE